MSLLFWLSQFGFFELRQPTGQRKSNVRMQKKNLIRPFLFICYEESLKSSNLKSNLFRFHCAHSKLYNIWERSSIFKVLLNSYICTKIFFFRVLTNLFLIWVFPLHLLQLYFKSTVYSRSDWYFNDWWLVKVFSNILQKKPSYLKSFLVKSSKTNHSQKTTFKKLQLFLGFIFCKIYFYTKARNFLHFL